MTSKRILRNGKYYQVDRNAKGQITKFSPWHPSDSQTPTDAPDAPRHAAAESGSTIRAGGVGSVSKRYDITVRVKTLYGGEFFVVKEFGKKKLNRRDRDMIAKDIRENYIPTTSKYAGNKAYDEPITGDGITPVLCLDNGTQEKEYF